MQVPTDLAETRRCGQLGDGERKGRLRQLLYAAPGRGRHHVYAPARSLGWCCVVGWRKSADAGRGIGDPPCTKPMGDGLDASVLCRCGLHGHATCLLGPPRPPHALCDRAEGPAEVAIYGIFG